MNDVASLLNHRNLSRDYFQRSTVALNTFFPPYKAEFTVPKQPSRSLLYEGSEKSLYETDRPDLLIMEFTAGHGEIRRRTKSNRVPALRNNISSYLFEYLEGFQINTHFVRQSSEVEMTVKRLDMIPIVVKIFNAAVGPLVKRFGMKEGTALTFPVVEHYIKDNTGGFQWLNESHVSAFQLATAEEFRTVNRLASKANAVLRALCERRDLVLAAVTLAFGKHKGQIMLGDELSPSTCIFWEKDAKTKTDRDRYSLSRTNSEEALMNLSLLLRRKGHERT